MNYTAFLDQTAHTFESYITSMPTNTEPLETEDFGWYNARFQSNLFRLAHVERYSDGKIDVLHVTTFPHKWSPEPIFGFDVICTQTSVVGVYMDLSPGILSYPFDEGTVFTDRKPLPDWAQVFSDRFLLLKPSSDMEFMRCVEWTCMKYRWYLNQLAQGTTGNIGEIVAVQNRYCAVQASNPRTYSVLKMKLGEERASHFMQHILFPQITAA